MKKTIIYIVIIGLGLFGIGYFIRKKTILVFEKLNRGLIEVQNNDSINDVFTIKWSDHKWINNNILYYNYSFGHFSEKMDTIIVKLDSTQKIMLFNIINDSTNFSQGDCGTFDLNARFVVEEPPFVTGKIDVGCGHNQLMFFPESKNSRYGSLNEQGFEKMKSLLNIIFSISKPFQK